MQSNKRPEITKKQFAKLLNHFKSMGLNSFDVRVNLLAHYSNVTKNRITGTTTVVFDNEVIEY